MTDLLVNIAFAATAIAFLAGLLLTASTGAARPVKMLLVILTGMFVIGFIGGLIFSRGLLIYLLFQIIALIILWYFMVILGAVCGGGIYLLIHKKPPGKNLGDANIEEYLPALEFAAQEGITEERAISRIKSGYYQGGLRGGAWYIHKSELSQK
jgi:hypothetical protein